VGSTTKGTHRDLSDHFQQAYALCQALASVFSSPLNPIPTCSCQPNMHKYHRDLAFTSLSPNFKSQAPTFLLQLMLILQFLSKLSYFKPNV